MRRWFSGMSKPGRCHAVANVPVMSPARIRSTAPSSVERFGWATGREQLACERYVTRRWGTDDRGVGSDGADGLVEIGEHGERRSRERREAVHRGLVEVDDAGEDHLLVVRGGERVHEADASGADEN